MPFTSSTGLSKTRTIPTNYSPIISDVGDLIVGGTYGEPQRLPKGAVGQMLGVKSDGTVGYFTFSGGFTNPMTAQGDLIIGGASGAATKLTVGANGKYLTVVGGVPAWGDVSALPSQTGNSGKYLYTDGTTASWSTVIPVQTGNSGKYLTTNGTSVSWSDVSALPSQVGNSGKILSTNGTLASWVDPPSTLPDPTGNVGKVLGVQSGPAIAWVTPSGGSGTSSYVSVEDLTSLIPPMVDATSPAGVASASSTHYTSNVWPAFSGDDLQGGWVNNGDTNPAWIQFEFNTPKVVGSYAIQPWVVDSGESRFPSTWTFLGSQDGTNWVTLDSHTGKQALSWTPRRDNVFKLTNTTAYKFYRLSQTANVGNSYFAVQKLKMFAPTVANVATGFLPTLNFTKKRKMTVVGGTSTEERVMIATISTSFCKADGSDIRIYASDSGGSPTGSPIPHGVLKNGADFQVVWKATLSAGVNNYFVAMYGDPNATYMSMTQPQMMDILGVLNANSSALGSYQLLTGTQYAYVPSVGDWGNAGNLVGPSGYVDNDLTTLTDLPTWTWDGYTGSGLLVGSNGNFGITTPSRSSTLNGGSYVLAGPDGFASNPRDMEQHFIRKVILPDGWYLQYECAYWSNRAGNMKITLRYQNDGTWTYTWFDSDQAAGPWTHEAMVNGTKFTLNGAAAPVRGDSSTYLAIRLVPKIPPTVGAEVNA